MNFANVLVFALLFLYMEVHQTTSNSAETSPKLLELDERNSARIFSEQPHHVRIPRGVFSGMKKRLHRKQGSRAHDKRSSMSDLVKSANPLKNSRVIDRALQAFQTGTDLFGHAVQLKHLVQQVPRTVETAVQRGIQQTVAKVPIIYMAPKPKVPVKKNSAATVVGSLKLLVAVFVFRKILPPL